MSGLRKVVWTGALGLLAIAAPAKAQFFFQPKDLRAGPVTGAEPGMVGPAMPGATPAEYRAALVWNLRAALNVAALQCGFEPGLLTVDNYNAMLLDHKDELKQSFDTVAGYFNRQHPKNKRAATAAFDGFQTRVYSAFSSVSAQYIFCLTSGSIGRDVIFAPRGQLYRVAQDRMAELRGALTPWGEQAFPRGPRQVSTRPVLPARFADEKCWRRDIWQTRRCGALY